MLSDLCARIASNDKKLREVSLDNENLCNVDVKLVCDALAGNTVVHTLWMHFNNITDGAPFATLLRANCTLTELNLRSNPLGAAGIAPIMQALQQNDSLRELHLSRTNLLDDGAALVAAALGRNNMLETIDLGYNGITDRGILSLLSALRSNLSLKALYLYENGCTDEGAQAIADMLRVNRTLTYVDLGDNRDISYVGHRALLDALEHNGVLAKLNCSFPDDMRQRLDALLKRNENETQLRKALCQDALVVFLGIRKLHRFESGIWVNQPREIIKMIAKLVYEQRDRSDWEHFHL